MIFFVRECMWSKSTCRYAVVCFESRLANHFTNVDSHVLDQMEMRCNQCPCVDCKTCRLDLRRKERNSLICGADARIETPPTRFKHFRLLDVDVSFQCTTDRVHDGCISRATQKWLNLVRFEKESRNEKGKPRTAALLNQSQPASRIRLVLQKTIIISSDNISELRSNRVLSFAKFKSSSPPIP